VLPQQALIERLRQRCRQDGRLVAAMLYGSCARNEADRFSDIDTILFFRDESLAEIDQRAWVSRIAPLELYYHNEFGIGVAIFSNLVRAEFHFDPASKMADIESWQGQTWFPSLEGPLLVDKTGQLRVHLQRLVGPPPSHDTPQDVRYLCDSFLNWYLFGTNVLARGEQARALEILNLVHDHLLRMGRLLELIPERWIKPTSALEDELSPAAYRRYQACTARLARGELWEAYAAAWTWGNEMLAALAERHSVVLPDALMAKIAEHVEQHAEA
jgi:lincosamide nucleotidyltransferase